MNETVQSEVEEGIGTVTLHRPDVYNAFHEPMMESLNATLRRLTEDDAVYVVILTGAGSGFCSGADVNEMPDWDSLQKEDYAAFLGKIQNVVRQLRSGPLPTIAAVNGPAIGAGCDLALACDLRVMDPGAVLREGFVRIGLIPGDGGAWLLPRLVGEARAREYLLTGRDIPAEEAREVGLAVDVDPDPLTRARQLAARLRDLPARAVRLTKQLVDPTASFEDYCRRAIDAQWACVKDPEHHEAVAAFRENREPDYDRHHGDPDG